MSLLAWSRVRAGLECICRGRQRGQADCGDDIRDVRRTRCSTHTDEAEFAFLKYYRPEAHFMPYHLSANTP